MKIVNRVLDNYYSKKFAESLRNDIKGRYKDIDLTYKFNHEEIELYIRLVKEKKYRFVCAFKKENAFECMIADRNKFNKFIDNFIMKREFLKYKSKDIEPEYRKEFIEIKATITNEDLNHGFMDKKSR